MKYLLFLAATTALLAQNPNTAVYPNAIATDTDLLVASNNANTTLTQSISAAATSLFLREWTRFVSPVIISIDTEILRCPSNVNGLYTCQRGFNGTAAISHSVGTAVHGYIVAWHHDQMAAEIKAIEGTLGPNLGNALTLYVDTTGNVSTFYAACSAAAVAGKTLAVTKVWTSVASGTCATNLSFVGGGSLQPASGQTVTLSGTLSAGLSKIFDYSVGGTVSLSGPNPTVYPEWWGGGTGSATPDTNAENYALAAFNCGTIKHSPQHVYTLAAINPITCGVIDGNGAAIQAATTGVLFTLNYNSPGPTGITRAPHITNVAFRAAGGFTPTDFIKFNTVNDALVDNNTFSFLSASHSIIWVAEGFGNGIRKNTFNEGNAAPRIVFLNGVSGANNATTIAENDFTQQNGICIEMTGAGLLRTTIIDNIIEGCTLGGVQLNNGNLYGFYYRNYNEANTNFDLQFLGTGYVVGMVDSSLFNNVNGIVFNLDTNLTVTGTLFDGACVDTNAVAVSITGAYRSIHNRQADIPGACSSLGEVTANMRARIPTHMEFNGSNDTYDPPTTNVFNTPACNASTKGYKALVSNGDASAGWGGVTGAGTDMVWTECNGTSYTNVGK